MSSYLHETSFTVQAAFTFDLDYNERSDSD
jgi:hypothetical protein